MFKSYKKLSFNCVKNKYNPYWNSESYWPSLIFLLIGAGVLIFAGMGYRTPWPADEPRFTEVAREMVQSGQWLFPMRGGELYPDKPPFFMWSIAALYWLLGNMKIAFLLPSALLSLVTLACVYDLTSKLWNIRTARLASLLLLLAPQFILQAKTAQIDAMLACWVTLAMYGLVRHFFVAPNWKWYFAAWGFMGLGGITKGVGFLPAFFLLPVLVLHFKFKHDFQGAVTKKLWLGPLVMLAVIAAWLVPMLVAASHSGNPDFIAYRDNILLRQTMDRYAHSWHHIQPWYYFVLKTIPTIWFPLYFVLFAKSFWQDAKQHPIVVALLIWVLCVICFFSATPGKRSLYLLPALPMLAVAVSHYITNFGFPMWADKVLKGLLYALAVIFTLGGLCFMFHAPFVMDILLDELNDPQVMGLIASSGGIAFFSIGLFCWWVIFKQAFQGYVVQLGQVFALTWLVYGFVLLPVLEPMRANNFKVMQNVQQIVGKNEVGMLGFKEQFLLAAPMDLTHFSYLDKKEEQERNAWQWLKEDPSRYIFTSNKLDFKCFDRSKKIVAGYAYGQYYILFDKSAMQPNCEAPKKKRRYHLKHYGDWPKELL